MRALFKAFGGVDAFPLCLDTQDVDEIVETVIRIAPAASAASTWRTSPLPAASRSRRELNDALDIPVFHDDQHGTAIVVLSRPHQRPDGWWARTKESVRGGRQRRGLGWHRHREAAALLRLRERHHVRHRAASYSSAYEGMNPAQEAMLEVTNLEDKSGTLADAMEGADVVIGVSAPGVITPEMVASMADDAIVFAMANPTPEIFPDEAKCRRRRAWWAPAGRTSRTRSTTSSPSPASSRGRCEARAERITEAYEAGCRRGAWPRLVSDEELTEEFIMPDPFDSRVADAVADAVRACAAAEREGA